jgi:hypothetical protein
VAATAWVFASLVFSTIDEPSGEDDGDGEIGVAAALNLFRTDPPFRRFVIARSLLLVSALSPPFVVTIAADRVGASVAQLGPFVVATGLASLVAGRLWGGAADRSSRLVMVTASGIGALIVVVFLGLLGPLGERTGLYIGTYLALAVVHTGARVGRSTYVVDLAEGDLRTQYVAASNTAMGVILLVVGAITGGLSTLGPEVALVTLAAIGLAGVPTSLSLPEVSRPAT